MDDVGILFFALLAVLCQLFLLTSLVLFVGRRFSSALARAWDGLVDTVAPVALGFAFAVATVTMLGSLYLSEVKGFLPCLYCWIQRALLYPLVLLTALGAFVPRVRRWAVVAIIVLCVLDIPVSAYHVLIEWKPSLHGVSSCDPDNPCTLKWYPYVFGYIGTPMMALTSALTVLTLTLMSRRTLTSHTQENSNG